MNFRNYIASIFTPRPVTPERMLDDLVALNKGIRNEDGEALFFNRDRAVDEMAKIRASLSPYGFNEREGTALAADVAYNVERVQASASRDVKKQGELHNKSVNQRILAAMRLAEEIIGLEGDLFSGIVSPIELSLQSRVWVTADDKSLMKDINGRLRAWNVVKTICKAWQDMEYYSAFYVSHAWEDGVPTPIHWSPKRVAVNYPGSFYSGAFSYVPTAMEKMDGDEAQVALSFFEAVTGWEWNDFKQGQGGAPLDPELLSWEHFLKPGHKVYPYPWLAKAATPSYTRQVIEEMRLALVMGVMNQLAVLTIEDPHPNEVTRLKEVIAANRAERVGFLIWRAGLEVKFYSPEAIESLLLPEAWWSATLDMFRRIGRPIRIVAGESPQRGGQAGSDAEIDTRIFQNKAMGHRQVVAEKIVLDLLRQWSKEEGASETLSKSLKEGSISVHMTPIQLHLGEDFTNIWGKYWELGIVSARTVHAGLGIDTDFETEMLKQEREEGFDEVYVARQQFAQRVATPNGEVTRSPEGGRPDEGKTTTKAAAEDNTEQLQAAFDQIEEAAPEDKERNVLAFIALLSALMRIHMRGAYREGYASAGGRRGISATRMDESIKWEQDYIDRFSQQLLGLVANGISVAGERYRVRLHPLSSWKRAYMDGVFQAKEEDGWRFWQRVLQPAASKTGPCQICIDDSKNWHPISEPFWDHPEGVCSAQFVRFMQTTSDNWESISRQLVEVPYVI